MRTNNYKWFIFIYFIMIPFFLVNGQEKKIFSTREVEIKSKDSLIVAEIMISGNKVVPDKNVFYYWYHDGNIYCNQQGITSYPLHGYYKIFDDQKRLVCLGNFNYGTKNGEWKYWLANGYLSRSEIYKNGILKDIVLYDTKGNAISSGNLFSFLKRDKKEKNKKDTLSKPEPKIIMADSSRSDTINAKRNSKKRRRSNVQ